MHAFTQMRLRDLSFSRKCGILFSVTVGTKTATSNFQRSQEFKQLAKSIKKIEISCVKSISDLGSGWMVTAVGQKLSAGKGSHLPNRGRNPPLTGHASPSSQNRTKKGALLCPRSSIPEHVHIHHRHGESCALVLAPR